MGGAALGSTQHAEQHVSGCLKPKSKRTSLQANKKSASRSAVPQPWLLPKYLRPFRRLLLGIAGPSLRSSRQVPQVRVRPAPPADAVPAFIQSALNQPELADVEFVLPSDSDGDAETSQKTFFAHRLVLAASCEHFRMTFAAGFAETVGVSGRCRVELPEWVMPRPMLWVLAYLYKGFDPKEAQITAYAGTTGRDHSGASGALRTARTWKSRQHAARFSDENTGEDLCCLLRLAEFYDLDHLKQWAEQQLASLMGPENLVALSTHAYFCNAAQLLQFCVYHLRQQYAELVGVQEWEDLEPAIKELVLTGV